LGAKPADFEPLQGHGRDTANPLSGPGILQLKLDFSLEVFRKTAIFADFGRNLFWRSGRRPVEPSPIVELDLDAFGIQVFPETGMLFEDDAVAIAAVALAADFDGPLTNVFAMVGLRPELKGFRAQKARTHDWLVGFAS
jgi:hypothetical protein